MEPTFPSLLLGDIAYEINRHISYIDMLALKRVIKGYRPVNFRSLVVSRFNSVGINGEEFCSLLHETNSILTGSFLLAILMSTEVKPVVWSGNDINIITKIVRDGIPLYESVGRRGEGCATCGYAFYCRSPFGHYFMKHATTNDDEGDNSYTIDFITNIKWNFPTIVVHDLTTEKDVYSVVSAFDFDMCKSSYNGKQLYVWNSDAIRKKRCYYAAREEITLINKYTPHDIVPMIISCMRSRISKYYSRGFYIELSDEARKCVDDTLV